MKNANAPRPNPVNQYEALIQVAQEILAQDDVQRVRSELYRRLARQPLDPQIQAVLDRVQLSAGWARNHLLSIGSWNESVRRAVKAGLPLRDGTVVAQIQRQFTARKLRNQKQEASGGEGLPDDAVTQWEHYALQPFYATEEAVTGRGVKGEVSAAIRQRTSEILALLKEDVIEATPEGWWVPSQRARSYTLPNSDVWLYDAFSLEAARRETLHPMIARAIVDKYSPPRGRIVDPMAGSGVIARAALELERWVWPSDAKPHHPRIHERDAFTLHREPQPGIGEAHLVVIHPPSFALWSQQKVEGTGGLSNDFMLILQDSYADFLSGLVEATLPLATLRGNLVVVLRPARITPYEVDSIFPFTAVFGALRDKAVAIAWHVAAARDGSEDWHILVFNNRSRSST